MVRPRKKNVLQMPESQLDPAPSILEMAQESLDADAELVTVRCGSVPASAFTLTDLLVDGARLLDDQQRQWFLREPGSPPERFSAFVGYLARMSLAPTLAVLRHQHHVPDVDLGHLHFDLAGAAEGRLTVWWPEHITLVEVDDTEAARTALVAQTIDFFTPLITAMNARVRLGPHKLWAQVVDAFTGCRPRYTDPAPQADRAIWESFQRIARTTVLHQGDSVLDIPHRDGPRQMTRATACCFVYKQPPTIEVTPLYPWSSGRWAGYCLVCPIISPQDSITRASYLLDRSFAE